VPRGCRVTGKIKEGCLQTPAGHQNMIIKYQSVGQWSWFSYQHVALNVLFQMRYDSLPNSKKQLSDRQRGWTPSVFTQLKDCFAYCFAQWCSPGVCRYASSFWSVTQSFLWAHQATIPHMKEDSNTFHMTPIIIILISKIVIFQCQSPYKSNSPRIYFVALKSQERGFWILKTLCLALAWQNIIRLLLSFIS